MAWGLESCPVLWEGSYQQSEHPLGICCEPIIGSLLREEHLIRQTEALCVLDAKQKMDNQTTATWFGEHYNGEKGRCPSCRFRGSCPEKVRAQLGAGSQYSLREEGGREEPEKYSRKEVLWGDLPSSRSPGPTALNSIQDIINFKKHMRHN